MKIIQTFVCLFFLISVLYISEILCLQPGLRIQHFAKMDIGIDELASQVGVSANEQDRKSSGASCATSCADTESCSGYLMCKDKHTSVCVFLKLTENSGRKTTQTNSQYASCILYLPANFQLAYTVKTKLSEDREMNSAMPSTSTAMPLTTNVTAFTTIAVPSTTTATITTTYTIPSFCSRIHTYKPSTSNGCTYGLRPGCNTYYRDCLESYELHEHKDHAIYLIKPHGYPMPFKVKCTGGSVFPRATHIQQNSFACCPSTSFNQSWAAYRQGFGNLENFNCSYWLGNDKVAALTAQRTYRLVLITKMKRKWAWYTNFIMKEESFNFKMQYNSFKKPSSYVMLDDGFKSVDIPNQNLNGAEFYTYDHDNTGHCASLHGSGWWFDKNCSRVNLNTDHDPQLYVNGVLNTFAASYMILT